MTEGQEGSLRFKLAAGNIKENPECGERMVQCDVHTLLFELADDPNLNHRRHAHAKQKCRIEVSL